MTDALRKAAADLAARPPRNPLEAGAHSVAMAAVWSAISALEDFDGAIAYTDQQLQNWQSLGIPAPSDEIARIRERRR